MAVERPFQLRKQLFILVHAGDGAPFAARLNLRKASRVVLALGLTFLMAICGSLLFFRELEVNRKLTDKLLELETRDKIAQVLPLPRAVAATAPGASQAPVQSPTGTETSTSASMITARVADMTTDCFSDDCLVNFALVPAQPGTASGELLVILETEVPRIGSGNPTTQVRKRYYLYPGGDTRDELTQSMLVSLPRKPFRLTHALQTAARFKIGKLLRPLAVNIYLFDRNKTLLSHERKVIDTED